MQDDVRRVSLSRFIAVAELLDHAFPDAVPVPDYLSHECERAEQSLLGAVGRSAETSDPLLAKLLGITHR